MISREQLSSNLINNTNQEFIEIVEQFANTTLAVYGDVINKEILVRRLNKIQSIKYAELPEGINASWTGSTIYINSKNKNIPIEFIKSLIYHELIHVISFHSEIDEDDFQNSPRAREGLYRNEIIPKLPNGTDSQNYRIFENEILDEIMTEFYANQLLKHEGIQLSGTETLKKYLFGANDFVKYNGTGYKEYSNLGKIYDFFFGRALLEAKLFDGNNFRKKFNNLFKNSEVFANLYTDNPYISDYSKFVNLEGIQERYETACKMFMVLLKNKYKNENIQFEESLLAQDESVNQFMEMLIKSKDFYDDKPKIKRDLFLLIQDLQMKITLELLGAEPTIETSNITTCIYMAYKKILDINPNIKLKDLQYQTFNITNFKGIVICDGSNKYLINSKLLSQELPMGTFKSFENLPENHKQSNLYSPNAEFATLFSTAYGPQSIIFKDNNYFDSRGNQIEISSPTKIINKSQNLLTKEKLY